MSLNRERYTGTIYGRASDLAIEFATACQPAVVNQTPVIDDASESVMGNALGSGGVRASGKELRDHSSASVRSTSAINYCAAMIELSCDDRVRNPLIER
jgi:hypothetical protein